MGVHTIYTRSAGAQNAQTVRVKNQISVDEIRRTSPDGLPASAAGPKLLVFFVLLMTLVLLVAAIAAGLLISPLVGVVVLILGFGFGLFVNPEVWVATSRAHERQKIIQHHRDEDRLHHRDP